MINHWTWGISPMFSDKPIPKLLHLRSWELFGSSAASHAEEKCSPATSHQAFLLRRLPGMQAQELCDLLPEQGDSTGWRFSKIGVPLNPPSSSWGSPMENSISCYPLSLTGTKFCVYHLFELRKGASNPTRFQSYAQPH